MDRPDTGIRAKITRTVVLHLARDGHLGEWIRPVDLDVGVALVVFKAHVEARLVALDQGHLKDQSFQLGADHDPFDVGNLPHQAACLGIRLGSGMEVGAHAAAQIDRLTDVDDTPGGVLHQVAASLIWEGIQDSLEVIGIFHDRYFSTLEKGWEMKADSS